MIRNSFKIAARIIFRNRGYTFISIFGLTLGLACCLYITDFIIDELSYDRHFDDVDRVYRISGSYNQGGASRNLSAVTTFLLYPAIQNEMHGYDHITRIENFGGLIRNGEKVFNEPSMIAVDSAFFSIFNFPILDGKAPYLNKPNEMVLTESMAIKVFGDPKSTTRHRA